MTKFVNKVALAGVYALLHAFFSLLICLYQAVSYVDRPVITCSYTFVKTAFSNRF